MPNTIDIRDAILQGVRKANVDYEQWSRGWWVGASGVEGLMVATIAGKLGSKLSEDESLLMECPFRYIKEWSEANPRPGRPPKTLKGKNGQTSCSLMARTARSGWWRSNVGGLERNVSKTLREFSALYSDTDRSAPVR